MSIPANRAELEAELRKLVEAHARVADNVACVECERCEGCRESTFCRSSKRLHRCNYCVDCERCTSSTHCRQSRDLLSCNHCEACERCAQSSYLTQCFDCTSCTYCFACVGLVQKDFHILNVPYSRSEYFALVAKLRGAAARPGSGR